jgi:hypothetical protein
VVADFLQRSGKPVRSDDLWGSCLRFSGNGFGFPSPNQDCANDDSNNPCERQASTFADPLQE